MQAIEYALGARARRAVCLLLAAGMALWALSAPAHAARPYTAASASPRPIPWTGWHGRPIRRPDAPISVALLAKATYPPGWSAGAVGFGSGYRRPGGSRRVREVQRRLTRLGYRTGPIDGLYGPLTRSAVQWFQIKHGLRPTGVVQAATLAVLRHPRAFLRRASGRVKLPGRPTSRPPVPLLARSTGSKPARSSEEVPNWLLPLLIAVVVLALGVAAVSLLAARRALRQRRRATSPLPQASYERPPAGSSRAESHKSALGYVNGRGLDPIEPHASAIADACEENGWILTQVVRDDRPRRLRARPAPGLSYVLDQLSQGDASRLVVARLADLGRSMVELRPILEWFRAGDAVLTVLDVELDTSTPEGQTALRAMLSVSSVEEARVAENTRKGLAAARASGRPAAVKDQPELARRIRQMRESGMSLQSIADTLNEEGVPTVRGGAMWRPSSVQTVLGRTRSASRE